MQANTARASRLPQSQRGVTILELLMTIAILVILSTAAVGNLRFNIIREREWELRRELREIRTAIDRYKDLSDKLLIRGEAGSEGYPPNLDVLVKGVYIGPSGPTIRFLRRVPVDPMTKKPDWVLRSAQDDEDSGAWGGNNVFDVHSNSQAKGLDGTPYSSW